ncbi:MAG: hypothetical protein QG667_1784 [Pseudomonadota bacterium]|jgi:hypothetical protein|nr:hypothetical protein [Pseudomonadota bacterium]
MASQSQDCNKNRRLRTAALWPGYAAQKLQASPIDVPETLLPNM